MTLRLIEVGDGTAVALDIALWGLVHVTAGYAAHRMPLQSLRHDRGILRLLPGERGGRVYERLGIRRWKDRLPEAGAFFGGGMSKRRIPRGADGGLERLAIETRRAELAHWWTAAALPLFVTFNPARALPLLALYALAVNIPCIAVQRYNRARLTSLLERRRHGSRVDVAARVRSSR